MGDSGKKTAVERDSGKRQQWKETAVEREQWQEMAVERDSGKKTAVERDSSGKRLRWKGTETGVGVVQGRQPSSIKVDSPVR